MTEQQINMSRERTVHKFIIRGIKIINVLLMTVPFILCWDGYYSDMAQIVFYRRGRIFLYLMFAVIYAINTRIYGALRVSISRISEMIYSQVLSFGIADVIMYLVCVLVSKHVLHIWPMLLAACMQLLIAVLWSVAANRWYFSHNTPLKTLIVWDMREGLEDLISSYGMGRRFRILSAIHVQEVVQNLPLLQRGEAVFLCGIHSHERNMIIKYCVSNGIRVYVIPRIGDEIMSAARPIHLFHLPMMRLERYNPTPEFIVLKRLFDILSSGLALIVLSPVMAVVALLIRRDGGTAFYRQKRLTKDGRVFELLKFRSMRMDAEKDGVARLSTGENDDRITPVGKVIRKVRLDELPQLWNILRGDMSVVGPRPERPEIAAQYEQELPEFSLRLQCKAGLTGYAQVYGKYNTTPYDKLLLDLRYISKPSIAEDLRIIFATIKILFQKESTEGITEGETTALGRKNAADAPESRAE